MRVRFRPVPPLAGALAIALILGLGGVGFVTAQSASAKEFPAAIVSGTCASPGTTAFKLAAVSATGLVQGTPMATMTANGNATPNQPVLESVTTIKSTLDDLNDGDHAIVVMGSASGSSLIACGEIGGAMIGPNDLPVGLAPVGESTKGGAVSLHDNGNGTTSVYIFLLVPASESAGSPAASKSAPAGASPVATKTAPIKASPVATKVAPIVASPVATKPASTSVSPVIAASPPPAQGSPSAGQSATAPTIEMVDIAYNPKEVTIPANTPVTITLKNNGAAVHNFSVTDHKNPNVKNLGISVDVQPGTTKTVTINAPAGDYYFFCNVPGHEAAGMFGTIHVK
jgi:plastocyanin